MAPSSPLTIARAAVGPLDEDTLLAADTWSRRVRDRIPVPATDLATALTTIGAAIGPKGAMGPLHQASPHRTGSWRS